jgi:hypothetical protein
LAVVHVAVYHTIIIAVSPHRAGKSADCGTDHRTRDYARASNRADASANRATDRGSGRDTTERRIITRRRTGIILTIVIITVDHAIVGARRPGGASKTANGGADDGALCNADTRKNCSGDGTARGTYRSTSTHVLRGLRIGRAGRKAHGSGGDHRQ